MHHRRPANERPKKSHHEIDGVICWQDAQVAHSWSEWVQRSQRHTLLQIIFMRHHAAFRPPAGSRRIHNRRGIAARARPKFRLARPGAGYFPAHPAKQIRIYRGFGNDDHLEFGGGLAAFCDAQLPPDRIFRDEHARARMFQQLPLLIRREFVIERHQHAARIKYRVRGDQPLGLIGHNDRGAISRRKSRVLQRFRDRHSAISKFPVRQPVIFALAVRLDEAGFIGKHLHGVF